jgi:hypothetical protein
MRAFDGQHSDNRKIRRSSDDLRRAIREIEGAIERAKSNATSEFRRNLEGRKKELLSQLQEQEAFEVARKERDVKQVRPARGAGRDGPPARSGPTA